MILGSVGGINTGGLSATMSASGTSGNTIGFATSPAIGSLTTSALPCGLTIASLTDNTLGNTFGISINDTSNLLARLSFTTIVMNARTFNTELATFTPSAGTVAVWTWGNAGVAVTGTGRAFVIA